jgi:hypothetical protein
MRRRRTLALFGASLVPAALSGCTAFDASSPSAPNDAVSPDRSSPPPDEAPRSTADSTASSTRSVRTVDLGQQVALDGTPLLVRRPTVQASVVVDTGEWKSVESEAGRQCLVVGVPATVTHERIDPDAFALVADGDRHAPERQSPVVPLTRSCSVRCLWFPVPVSTVSEAAVVYGSDGTEVHWTLPPETVDRFAAAPDVRLRDAAVVDVDGTTGVELTAENVGDRDGHFRALVGASYVADHTNAVSFSVPRAATVTKRVTPPVASRYDPAAATLDGELTASRRYVTIREPVSTATDTAADAAPSG